VATSRYVIRDDGHYTVVVGWTDELASFFARVYSAASRDGEPILETGTEPRQVPTVSGLAEAVQGFATVDAPTVSALRHDATPL
jgi:hypothetical protein